MALACFFVVCGGLSGGPVPVNTAFVPDRALARRAWPAKVSGRSVSNSRPGKLGHRDMLFERPARRVRAHDAALRAGRRAVFLHGSVGHHSVVCSWRVRPGQPTSLLSLGWGAARRFNWRCAPACFGGRTYAGRWGGSVPEASFTKPGLLSGGVCLAASFFVQVVFCCAPCPATWQGDRGTYGLIAGGEREREREREE